MTTQPLTNTDARRLAARISKLENLVRSQAHTAQLGYSSIDNRALVITDADGVDRGTVGVLPDGTVGVLATNGPPPPQPSEPALTPVVTALAVTWDGTWATPGEVTPLDLARVEVHSSTAYPFTADATTLAGSIERTDGGTVMIPAATGTATYVRLVAVNTSGIPGPPSTITSALAATAGGNTVWYQDAEPTATDGLKDGDTWVDTDSGNRSYLRVAGDWQEITDARVLEALQAAQDAKAAADGKIRTYAQPDAPTGLTDADVGDVWYDTGHGNLPYRWDGQAWVPQTVGTDALDDAAVTTAKITDLAVTTGKIASLAVEKLTSGTLTAGRITVTGLLTTSATGAGQRVDYNAAGIRQYDAAGVLAVSIAPTGSSFRGAITSGSTITGATITGSTVRATGSGDVTLTSTAHALQAGPDTGVNLAIDGNELQARNNKAATSLNLNLDGGNINLGSDVFSADEVFLNHRVHTRDRVQRDAFVVSADYDTGYASSAFAVETAEEAGLSTFNVMRATTGIGNASMARRFTLRADGNAFCSGSWSGGGADYAEMFESVDGTSIPLGRVVTLVAGKVRAATAADFLLGITSGAPTTIGNNPTGWPGQFVRDVYGRTLVDDRGVPQVSPGFDPDAAGGYTPRTDRPEWVAVGLVGQLVADDDGTCIPEGLAVVAGAGEGTLTYSDGPDGYRVIERVDDRHVRVLVLPQPAAKNSRKKPRP
jgi:Peptidase_G2, IMC autoproteolytic cleavage domain